jgi:hypothetical protein
MKRLTMVLTGALVLALLLAGTALAATPQDIYNDFVTNGTLTGTYTVAELEAFLNDATIIQYANQAVLDQLKNLVQKLLTQETRPVFPFTGFELLLAGLGGAALIGTGLLLRRSRRR